MARKTQYNNSNESDVSGTAGNDADIVSITGSGMVDALVCKALDLDAESDFNGSNHNAIDFYVLEIDGTSFEFEINLPFSNELGVLTTANALIEINRPQFFQTSFKLQARFNATTNVSFKFMIMSHVEA